MQVHATYENGRLIFQQPIRLKYPRVAVEVLIPDNALEYNELDQKSEQPSLPLSPIRQELNALMGEYARKRPAVSPTHDKEIWHCHLVEKYSGGK